MILERDLGVGYNFNGTETPYKYILSDEDVIVYQSLGSDERTETTA